ncbi:MAG: hypothetical protein EXR75_09320 [Myxococcales bacterium]|nr:hypothetical protein [Myxococcales bacterium]
MRFVTAPHARDSSKSCGDPCAPEEGSCSSNTSATSPTSSPLGRATYTSSRKVSGCDLPHTPSWSSHLRRGLLLGSWRSRLRGPYEPCVVAPLGRRQSHHAGHLSRGPLAKPGVGRRTHASVAAHRTGFCRSHRLHCLRHRGARTALAHEARAARGTQRARTLRPRRRGCILDGAPRDSAAGVRPRHADRMDAVHSVARRSQLRMDGLRRRLRCRALGPIRRGRGAVSFVPFEFDSHLSWLRLGVAMVWLLFGLLFKALDVLPRHRQIVARVVGTKRAGGVLWLVAISEITLALWMLTGRALVGCVAVQTALIVAMNTLELRYARDLLLSPIGMVCANAVFLAVGWYLALATG